jgi:hypothetical protein
MSGSRFSATVEIRGASDLTDTVHFKSDGTRFGEVNTVKLNVEKSYSIRITLRPQRLLM